MIYRQILDENIFFLVRYKLFLSSNNVIQYQNMK